MREEKVENNFGSQKMRKEEKNIFFKN